jgi:hypothetical protein
LKLSIQQQQQHFAGFEERASLPTGHQKQALFPFGVSGITAS